LKERITSTDQSSNSVNESNPTPPAEITNDTQPTAVIQISVSSPTGDETVKDPKNLLENHTEIQTASFHLSLLTALASCCLQEVSIYKALTSSKVSTYLSSGGEQTTIILQRVFFLNKKICLSSADRIILMKH